MLTFNDIAAIDRIDVYTSLEVCRDGLLYTAEAGYAFVDGDQAELDDPCMKEHYDRLIDHNLMVVGRSERVRLEDGTYTTAVLEITDAGKRLFDELAAALGR